MHTPPSRQVLNDATAAGRPALGASFTFMTDVTLYLERATAGQDRELRTAEVLRSRVSVRAPSHPSPPFFFSPDGGIDDCVLLRDVEGTLHVSNTARKGTRKLGSRRLHPPILSPFPVLPFHPRSSLTTMLLLNVNQKFHCALIIACNPSCHRRFPLGQVSPRE